VRQEWIDRPEGGTMFGYKLLSGFARGCGRTAARIALYPITLYFLIRRGPERRASREISAADRRARNASLWQVAKTPSLLRGRNSRSCVSAFRKLQALRRTDVRARSAAASVGRRDAACCCCGSHLGSFDALRVLADFRSDIKLRVVIDVGQNRNLSDVLNALNPQLAQSVINAREEGTTTALLIKEALDEKSLVTLLADRARPGNQVMTADFLGRPAPFPTAPWQLAAALKVPVVLCFGLYPRRQSLRSALRDVHGSAEARARASVRPSCGSTIQRFRRPGGSPRAHRAVQLVQLL
jgi:predicted LPLAT superfamily acyltransferase